MSDIKPNNSKGLKAGDIVQHERGWTGRVREVEHTGGVVRDTIYVVIRK